MRGPLTERQAFLILNSYPGLGPVRRNALLADAQGDALRVLASLGDGWRRDFDLEREEENFRRHGADFITPREAAYPAPLREIHDPPLALYRMGGYGFDRPCVAIVGSRRTTLYGVAVATALAGELARAGFCVASGLARGIDAAAHAGALEAGGRTVAVLGTGLDIVYPPENRSLHRQIAERGALLSEFRFGFHPDRGSFPQRNRIVSGISTAVVVVESDASGGSMITARFAGEQGRALFAVPGRIDQPTSAGCHQLIRDGATLLTSVDDILSELSYLDGLRPLPIPPKARARRSVSPPLAGDEKTIFDQFSGGAILAADALAGKTGLAAGQVSAALMMLELKGRVAKRLDGHYEAASSGR